MTAVDWGYVVWFALLAGVWVAADVARTWGARTCGDASCTGGWSNIGGEKQTCSLRRGHGGPHRSVAGVEWNGGRDGKA